MPDTVFDFATRDCATRAEQGAELEVTDPLTGESVGGFITLAGADSSTYRHVSNMLVRRRLKNGGRAVLDPDKLREESIEILAACTLSWKGVIVEGKSLPCTRENAVMLYTRFPWLKEQAEAFVADRASYFRD